ncbi:MAG: fibronectin type III domain-containing protein, partial [Acidobacteriia bacterium]|nr:fibronectin type III domain-containing protein [Terriglobia bacterium]
GLSGLTGSTLYHYRVKSKDAAGNLATSGDFTFTTSATPDTTPPTISAVSSSSITSSAATISWTTDEASDSQVDYGTTTGYGSSTPLNASLVTSHSAGLSGLTGSTLYHYRVKSKDAAGNLATSGDFTFTTSATPDTTPPIISAVSSSSITSSAATISWTTDEASDSQVDYGTTTGYGSSTALNASLVTAHSAGLSGLTGSTLYHYRVKSKDAAGNMATSGDFTFSTLAATDTTAPVISSVGVISVDATTATMSWTTNEAADSQVEYGTTTAYGTLTSLSPSLVTAHSIGLTGLSANTQYHYRVRSRDAAANLALSEDFAFTTTTEETTNRTCSQGTGLCFEATLPPGGGLSRVSFGQGDLSVLFGLLNASGTSWPVALANFGFTQNGVLVTEVGVPATGPINSTRLFVDYSGPGSDSGVALVNPNDSPILVNAQLRNPRGEFVASSSVSVEGKGHTAQFVSQLIADMPNPFLGTLTLSSTSPFAAVNLRLATNAHGETLFSALPLADLNHPFPGTKLIFPQVIDGGGLPTQILLMNPSVMGTITGFISFFDDDGNDLALDFGPGVGVQNALTYSLVPNGMVKYSTTGLGPLRVGYAVVTPLSGALPVGSGVFSINGSAGLSSQAGVPNAAETTMSRLFVERATDPLPRDTGVAIVNRNSTEAQVTLTLQSVDGSTMSGSLTLPPNGHVARFISELFPGMPAQYQGVLTMTSSVPLAAMTLRQTFNQRSEAIYSTLPVADLTRPPEGPMYIPQVADGGGYQTQLILINTSDSISLVQIEFFNDHGTNLSLPLR